MRRFNEHVPKTEIRGARLQRAFIVMTLLKYISMIEIYKCVVNNRTYVID